MKERHDIVQLTLKLRRIKRKLLLHHANAPQASVQSDEHNDVLHRQAVDNSPEEMNNILATCEHPHIAGPNRGRSALVEISDSRRH
jgi:hypothetical protein